MKEERFSFSKTGGELRPADKCFLFLEQEDSFSTNWTKNIVTSPLLSATDIIIHM
ncbi:MAG: hypothetical protein WBL88_16625 [Nitrososphaeraceae archaeon]